MREALPPHRPILACFGVEPHAAGEGFQLLLELRLRIREARYRIAPASAAALASYLLEPEGASSLEPLPAGTGASGWLGEAGLAVAVGNSPVVLAASCQALEHGCPVIAPASPIWKELIGNGGEAVPCERGLAGLAEAGARWLLQDPLCRETASRHAIAQARRLRNRTTVSTLTVAEQTVPPSAGAPYRRLSVVLALYGQRDLTERCLRTLRHDLAGDPFARAAELICVDNASPDDTREWLARQADVLTLPLTANYGCAGGWNRGLRAASGDVLCVLNNDTEILPGGLRALAQAAWECGIAAFSGGMLDDRILFAGSTTDRGLSDYPEGTALAFRRDVWETVGPFDEGMRFGYGEDSDWGLRARALGFSWAILPGILVHLGSRTAPHVPGLFEAYAQNQRRLEARWRDHLPSRPKVKTSLAAVP